MRFRNMRLIVLIQVWDRRRIRIKSRSSVKVDLSAGQQCLYTMTQVKQFQMAPQ